MPDSHLVKIKLPNSNGLAIAMGGAFGVFYLVAALLTLLAQPSKLLDKMGIVVCLVLGVALLWYGVRAALEEHALHIHHQDNRLLLLPGKHVLALDDIESISVWRTTGDDPRRLRWRGARSWGVYLMQTDGQEIVVWEGQQQETAQRVACEISEQIDRPWIGGSKTH